MKSVTPADETKYIEERRAEITAAQNDSSWRGMNRPVKKQKATQGG